MNVKQLGLAAALVLSFAMPAHADRYVIDTKGAHAFIQFKIQHLGYSWLSGRFNTFEGAFEYDEKKPNESSVKVNIDTASVDSNHAARDKHLRSKDFLEVDKFPQASFVSTSFAEDGKNITLKGKFTLHGVTKDIVIKGHHVGAGADPWGGFRRGFEGSTTIALKDYNILMNLGPASQDVQLTLSVEGIRQ